MSTPADKTMVCIHCGMKISATLQQAKRHGWTIWIGGGCCKTCRETMTAKGADNHLRACVEYQINRPGKCICHRLMMKGPTRNG